MAAIMNYLQWRGDIPFSCKPMNDVDSYIISKIGTIDWSGIVPEDAAGISLADAVKSYIAKGGTDYLGLVASRQIYPVVISLPETQRFGSLELTMYTRKTSLERTEQFSALTVGLPNGDRYISFRGTDDTLVGWKEDCLFAVENEVSAQRNAVEYLEKAAEAFSGKLVVGGHSKGGNLAVYAAANVPTEIQNRIEIVYDFDGPGFEKDFFLRAGYLNIRDKIRKIYAKNAMVGTLMHNCANVTVVDCSSIGIAAHDGFTWETGPNGFIPYPELTPAAKAFNEAMDKLLQDMTTEKRKEFIEALFDSLAASGAETLTGLTEQGIRKSISMVRTLNKDPAVHHMVSGLLELMTREYFSEKVKGIKNRIGSLDI